MNALILAAGRGERMRPLSDQLPKPLLRAGERSLIEWQIAGLTAAGIRRIVINTAHHAALIEDTLGDGSRYGAQLLYSREGARAEDALETLGGIVHALPLLEPAAAFVVVSGDIVTDFDYRRLVPAAARIEAGAFDAHFVLVDNPAYHRGGDMGLIAEPTAGPHSGLATMLAPLLTYANIGVFAPRLFQGVSAERRKLFPWAFRAVEQARVSAEHFTGRWYNVGTPGDLAELDSLLRRTPLEAGHT